MARRDRFKPGDRVELVAPFRFRGDDRAYDTMMDSELRVAASSVDLLGRVFGTVGDGWMNLEPYGGITVIWDANKRDLYVDEDVVEFANKVTPEDVQAAIESIKKAGGSDGTR